MQPTMSIKASRQVMSTHGIKNDFSMDYIISNSRMWLLGF